jgi:hypothetical protein
MVLVISSASTADVHLFGRPSLLWEKSDAFDGGEAWPRIGDTKPQPARAG